MSGTGCQLASVGFHEAHARFIADHWAKHRAFENPAHALQIRPKMGVPELFWAERFGVWFGWGFFVVVVVFFGLRGFFCKYTMGAIA